MNYEIIQKFITKNRSNKKFKPNGIVLHETATAGASDEQEYNYFCKNDVEASAHAFVDWDSITQTVPFDEIAWHSNRPANALFLGVEMCRPKTHNEAQFTEVYNRTVWLFAHLFINTLNILTITKDNLMSHDEVRLKWKITTHTDPTAYLKEYNLSMDIFRKDVQNKINELIKPKVIIQNIKTLPKTYKYSLVSTTHVVEINPLDLKILNSDTFANKFLANNYVTSGFITWEAILDSNKKKTGKVRSVPLGILVSEGKVISNRQPHRIPTGTLIVFKDGSVICKPILDITKEVDISKVWFAVSGCTILPSVRMKEEGFKSYDNYFGLGKRDFSDIGRSVSRPLIGYNPTTKKIIIAVRPDTDITRARQSLLNLGCTFGITLDAGGSTVLKVDNKILVNSTRQLYSVLTW